MDTLEELWNEQEMERRIREELKEVEEDEIQEEEESIEPDFDESGNVVAYGRPTGDRPEE